MRINLTTKKNYKLSCR